VSVAVAALVAVAVLKQPAPLPELTMPLAGGPGDPAATTTTTAAVEPPAAEVVVHAAGAVNAPGLHRLPAGARVADLLDVAGGPAPGADLDRLNLAAPLVDGERIFVPMPDQVVPVAEASGPGATGPGAGGPAGTSTPRSPVDLNRATLADLEALPGVGPATAQAILDERARRGRFGSVEELLEVRGIGDAKLAALRDLVRV
jgi:competence protein ComEA